MGRLMGTLQTASLWCRGRSGPLTGRWSARSGQRRERETSTRKSVRGLNEPIRNAPDVTPMPVAAVRRKNKAPPSKLRRIHRAASRLKDGKPAVGVAPVRRYSSGPLLVAVEREPSPNQTVARFDSPAKG